MSPHQQATFAQDLIHAARTYRDNAEALEYLASFAFSLARWLDDTSTVLWDDIHAVCEQRYVSLQSGRAIDFDEHTLRRCEAYTAHALSHTLATKQPTVQCSDRQKTYRDILKRDVAAALKRYRDDAQMRAYIVRFARKAFGDTA